MTLSFARAVKLTGAKPAEIVEVLDSPAGDVINMVDGSSLIFVSADNPDADGKTGLMLAVAPLNEDGKYLGSFPVYTQPAVDEVEPEGTDWATAKVDDILAYAAAHLDEVVELLRVERANKGRKTAVEGLEALLTGGAQ